MYGEDRVTNLKSVLNCRSVNHWVNVEQTKLFSVIFGYWGEEGGGGIYTEVEPLMEYQRGVGDYLWDLTAYENQLKGNR